MSMTPNRLRSNWRPRAINRHPSLEKADLVILNTCTIRAKAEQKAFSFLGRLARLKKKKPGLIVGVGGCVAQQEGAKILKRVPHLDLVFGTQAIDRLPALISKIEAKRCRIVDVAMSENPDLFDPAPAEQNHNPVSRFVTIMRGCDNFCTYCVVPYVRGRESSRHPDNIIKEIKMFVDSGVKEVTLLGQNVNSYGKKEGIVEFHGIARPGPKPSRDFYEFALQRLIPRISIRS